MSATCGQMRVAGAYVPPHRPDHERFDEPPEPRPNRPANPPEAIKFYTAKSGRVYVEIGDVARLTGLRAMDLDFKFRPRAWACPRDFTWEHGRVWFAVLSLPQLVDALFDAGRGDPAILLRDAAESWIVKLAASYRPTGREVAPPILRKPISGADAQARWEEEHP